MKPVKPVMITVRVPKEFRERLKRMAHKQWTSCNQLCIAYLARGVAGDERRRKEAKRK